MVDAWMRIHGSCSIIHPIPEGEAAAIDAATQATTRDGHAATSNPGLSDVALDITIRFRVALKDLWLK